MQLEAQKYLNRCDAVVTFIDARTAYLAQWAKVGTLKTQLVAKRGEIVQFAQQQEAAGGSSSQQVRLKQTLIDALLSDLEDMARTAKVLSIDSVGFDAEFQLPSSKGEQAIVGAARVFKENATPAATKAEFIAMGMPTDFLDDLESDIAAYDAFASAKTSAQQAASEALKNLDEAIRSAGRIIDTLDALIRNIYRYDKSQLAAWQEAKRLRDNRAHRVKPPTTAPAPDGHALGNG